MWTLNNIQITVIDLKEEYEPIIAELQPLASGTVYHYFGYISPRFPLQCLVVGEADKNSVLALANTGVPYTLAFNASGIGNFYVKKASASWMTSYAQSFRPDKPRESLIFRIGLDLARA